MCIHSHVIHTFMHAHAWAHIQHMHTTRACTHTHTHTHTHQLLTHSFTHSLAHSSGKYLKINLSAVTPAFILSLVILKIHCASPVFSWRCTRQTDASPSWLSKPWSWRWGRVFSSTSGCPRWIVYSLLASGPVCLACLLFLLCRQALGLFCWIIVVCFYDSIHFYPCPYLTFALLVHGPHVVWECVCVYVCMCVCAYVCVCVWTEWSWSMHCVGISTNQFILYYASVDMRTYACTCAHMHACTHACMRTRTQILQPHCHLTACLTLMLPPVKCACRVMVWSLSATSSVSVSTWSRSSVKCLPPGPSFQTADWMVERERWHLIGWWRERGGIWLDGEEMASDWMVRERWHLIGRWKMLSDWIVERELASDWMIERGGTSDRVMDTKGTSAQMREVVFN